MTMIAYHGDPELKARTLAELAAHRAADQIIQQTYWDGERGCAVGCLTKNSRGGHSLFPERWGIPVEVAELIDGIHETFTLERARFWPERIMSAIPVGADMRLVWPRFAHWLLTDPEDGLIGLAGRGPSADAIPRVAELVERVIAGDPPSPSAWITAPCVAQSMDADPPAAVAGLVANVASYGYGADRVPFHARGYGLVRPDVMADQLVALCRAAGGARKTPTRRVVVRRPRARQQSAVESLVAAGVR